MHLVQLIYVSSATAGFNADAMEQILETSRQRNAARFVTGYLCFNAEYFLQVLEGPAAAVNETFHHIHGDSRHVGVTLLDYSVIGARRFSDWAMGYAGTTRLTRPLLLKYSAGDNFQPAAMSADSALRLMADLAAMHA